MIGWKPKSNDPKVASVRFRCLVPLEELTSQGFPAQLFDPGNEFEYKVVIFSKCYEPADLAIAMRLRARGVPVVLDLCDNHFYNPEGLPAYQNARQNLMKMIEVADLITCSTPYLAEVVAKEARLDKLPEVVGDPVELANEAATAAERMSHTATNKASAAMRRLLWFGIHGSPNAPCGMTDVVRIADELNRVGKESPFELVICSNSRDTYEKHIRPLDFPTTYEEFNRNEFSALLSEMDGVILPVSPNPFTLAKSHNRLTTALFAGVPVVADGLPSYREFSDFCFLDDWQGGLQKILYEPLAARQKALAGKKYIQSKWLPVHIAARWRSILQPLLRGTLDSSEALTQ
jgi:hypothetical protein